MLGFGALSEFPISTLPSTASGTTVITSALCYLEDLATQALSGKAPLENISTQNRSFVDPFEGLFTQLCLTRVLLEDTATQGWSWLIKLENIATQKNLPKIFLENVATQQLASIAKLETLLKVTPNPGISLETLLTALCAGRLPFENTGATMATLVTGLPLEFAALLLKPSLAPQEISAGLRTYRALEVESLATQKILQTLTLEDFCTQQLTGTLRSEALTTSISKGVTALENITGQRLPLNAMLECLTVQQLAGRLTVELLFTVRRTPALVEVVRVIPRVDSLPFESTGAATTTLALGLPLGLIVSQSRVLSVRLETLVALGLKGILEFESQTGQKLRLANPLECLSLTSRALPSLLEQAALLLLGTQDQLEITSLFTAQTNALYEYISLGVATGGTSLLPVEFYETIFITPTASGRIIDADAVNRLLDASSLNRVINSSSLGRIINTMFVNRTL